MANTIHKLISTFSDEEFKIFFNFNHSKINTYFFNNNNLQQKYNSKIAIKNIL